MKVVDIQGREITTREVATAGVYVGFTEEDGTITQVMPVLNLAASSSRKGWDQHNGGNPNALIIDPELDVPFDTSKMQWKYAVVSNRKKCVSIPLCPLYFISLKQGHTVSFVKQFILGKMYAAFEGFVPLETLPRGVESGGDLRV